MMRNNRKSRKETATTTIRKMTLTTGLALLVALAGLAGAQAIGTEDIYISASGSGNAGGISFADEDIVLCDRFGGVPGTCSWSMFFDGSAEGISNQSDLTAFHVEDDDNILMAFKTPKRFLGTPLSTVTNDLAGPLNTDSSCANKASRDGSSASR